MEEYETLHPYKAVDTPTSARMRAICAQTGEADQERKSNDQLFATDWLKQLNTAHPLGQTGRVFQGVNRE